MAKSHAEVARLFAHCKVARGSRMESVITGHQNVPHTIFTRRILGVSYRTTVAQIVVNQYTQKSELWLTPAHYSTSTSRHKNYYRSAFLDAYCENHGCSREEASQQVFITRAVSDGTNRENPAHARMVLNHLPEWLVEADKPRLRSATRYGALQSGLGRLQRALDLMTRDIDLADAQTRSALQDSIAFLENTLAIADVDEMRAAVRGYLALTRD